MKSVLNQMLDHESKSLFFDSAVRLFVDAKDVCVVSADRNTGKNLALDLNPELHDVKLMFASILRRLYHIKNFLFDDSCDS
jgi:hypothetical protein